MSAQIDPKGTPEERRLKDHAERHGFRVMRGFPPDKSLALSKDGRQWELPDQETALQFIEAARGNP